MVKISNASYENKILRFDIALSMSIPKYDFFGQGGPNFGEGAAVKFKENGENREIYCFAN